MKVPRCWRVPHCPARLALASRSISRRRALHGLAVGAAGLAVGCAKRRAPALRLATFRADVTAPPGHPMMGGAWLAKSVADPLEAHGIVLLGAEESVVWVSVDWCEIRNEAYFRWQAALAAAAGTRPERVMITTVHQHDAPLADLAAERLLRSRGAAGTVCDLDFHERAVQTVADAVRQSLGGVRTVTHLGTGQAKVERVASLRRYLTAEGAVRFDRMSRTENPAAIAAAEGGIDPWLKTLSFWRDAEPLAALHFYAVHPMSHYGAGEVSADFPGLARRQRQAETAGTHQIYCSGGSGNVTAGKYNTGARENRAALAGRLHAAMTAAWRETRRQPVREFTQRNVPLRLEPRDDASFTPAELERQLTAGGKPFPQCLAALGLSWRERLATAPALTISALDFGPAQLLLLPGESYVEYQLAAQQMRPDHFICVAGYGDGAAGYIPTEKYFAEGDTNLRDWCWIAPGCEAPMMTAMRHALKAPLLAAP